MNKVMIEDVIPTDCDILFSDRNTTMVWGRRVIESFQSKSRVVGKAISPQPIHQQSQSLVTTVELHRSNVSLCYL